MKYLSFLGKIRKRKYFKMVAFEIFIKDAYAISITIVCLEVFMAQSTQWGHVKRC